MAVALPLVHQGLPLMNQTNLIEKFKQYLTLQGRYISPSYGKGYCLALSLLWGYWKALDKEKDFFHTLEKVASWDGVQITKEISETFEKALNALEWMQKSETITLTQVQAREINVSKLFAGILSDELPVVKNSDFSMSFTFTAEEIQKVLDDLLKNSENKIILVQTVHFTIDSHAIGISYKNGQYYFYDPSFLHEKNCDPMENIPEKKTQSVQVLVEWIQKALYLNFDRECPLVLPLNINVCPIENISKENKGHVKPEEWIQEFIQTRNQKTVNNATGILNIHQPTILNGKIETTPMFLIVDENNVDHCKILLEQDPDLLFKNNKSGNVINFT